MQNKLLSTTALVAAAALVSPFVAGKAVAAEPLELSIGGYFQTGFQITDQDDGAGEPAAGLQDTSVHTDGEIQFTAKTTLDNGLSVSVRIEFEAHNQGASGGAPATIVDERHVTFSGDFGQLRIGSEDPPTSGMQYQAPGGAGVMGVNSPTFAIAAVGGNAVSSYPSTYADWSSDSGNIAYFSPRMSGFQLGISYQPDGSRNDVAGSAGGIDGAAFLPRDDNAQEDVIGIGLNFVESFNGVDVAVYGGYLFGSAEVTSETTGSGDFELDPDTGVVALDPVVVTPNVFEDRDTFNAGLQVGFSGVTVGASFLQDDQGKANSDVTVWDVGVSYATGPWTVGVTYLHAEAEDTGGDDEVDGFVVSGTYNLGPGVNIWAGVKWYDYQDGANSAADENEAVFGMLGTSVSF